MNEHEERIFKAVQQVMDEGDRMYEWLLAESRELAELYWMLNASERGGEERRGREDDPLPWRRPSVGNGDSAS